MPKIENKTGRNFARNWATYNHVYNIGDSYGVEDEDVSEEKYEDSLELVSKYNSECEEEYNA